MPKINFHPEAARAIDARGEALVCKVGNLSPEPQRPRFVSQRVPHHKITQADIVGRIRGQTVDEYKREVTAVKFEGPGGMVGLKGESVRDLDKTSQLAHKYLATRVKLSDRFMRDSVSKWIEQA